MLFNNIKMWYLSKFTIMTLEDAMDYELCFVCNFYGDEINRMNCRSLFADEHGRYYKVNEVYFGHRDV